MSLVKELAGERQGDFREFCLRNIVLDSGKPYDPYGRACMVEIVEQLFEHPHLCIEKGEQTGFSTLFIAYVLYMTDQRRRNLIYFLPTDEFVALFTPTRFDPTIERSAYLTSRLSNTDNKNAKQVGSNFLYIRGLKSKSGAISVPADAICYDEVALTDKTNLELAEGRIAASDLAWRRYFSAPLFEEDNIDEIFQASDQRAWTMMCPSCNREQIAEEHFPDNLVKPKGGKAFVACYHCGKPLDLARGLWVPKFPERSERLGYRVPQLIVPGVNLDLAYDRTQEAIRKPSKMAQIWRSVAGIPAAGNMQPVSEQVLTRVSSADPYYLQTRSELPCYMGIDMGDTANVSIRQPQRGGPARWVWFQEISTQNDQRFVEEICRLEEVFQVHGTIVDGMPYRPTSRKLVRALKRWAAIHDFRGDETKVVEEGEDGLEINVVRSEREQSIDDMLDELLAEPPLALMPLPRDAEQEQLLKVVHRQMKKLVKEEVQTAAGKVIHYKDKVENHYGMAMTYATLAQQLAPPPKIEILRVRSDARDEALRGY